MHVHKCQKMNLTHPSTKLIAPEFRNVLRTKILSLCIQLTVRISQVLGAAGIASQDV